MTTEERLAKTHEKAMQIREMWGGQTRVYVSVHDNSPQSLPLPDGSTGILVKLGCAESWDGVTLVRLYENNPMGHHAWSHCDECSCAMVKENADADLLTYAAAARVPIVSPDTTTCPTCAWNARDGDEEEEEGELDRGTATKDERCPGCGSDKVSDQARLHDRACGECFHHWMLAPDGGGE